MNHPVLTVAQAESSVLEAARDVGAPHETADSYTAAVQLLLDATDALRRADEAEADEIAQMEAEARGGGGAA